MSEQNEQQVPQEELANAPIEDEGSLLDTDEAAKKLNAYVLEVIHLFRPRVESGEMSQLQVAEVLSIALTGTIYGTVPPHLLERSMQESTSLMNYLGKQYDGRVSKKKYMFASNLMGVTRLASFLVSQSAARYEAIKAKFKAAEEAQAAETAATQETTTTE